MKSALIIFTGIIIVVFSLIIFGCGDKKNENNLKQHEITTQSGSEIVRDFDVVVASLDENEDGKLFQCPMDWQVISDAAGNCPLCNMNLKEFTVTNAKKNLEEHRPHNH